MLRLYLWLALLFAIPIGLILGTWLLLAHDLFQPEATSAALGFGLIVMGLAMWRLRRRIRDDRGKRLPGPDALPLRAVWRSLGLVVLLTFVSAVGWCGSFLGRACFEMVLDDEIRLWPYAEPGVKYDHPSIPWIETAILIASLLPGLVAAMVVAAWSQRRFGPAARLGRGLCGGCGYDLHALVEQEDGCRICPECGAAWRLKRVSQED